ncbi:hypothetical protein [Sphingomonas sp. R1]|uniref:hypothetical protein n=1 Tax=Sphingomonas sp. R1 TaxID=399176 RepID=UPI00222576DD|nr:hypothetical protein [Sphingomonas sp. R1]UYY77859.1 hypothetical protein OIM94_02285 [Sphingomonas sp. R1]
MDRRSFLYALWSIGILGLFLAATSYGWSPFAEGGRTDSAAYSSGGHGGDHAVFYGPHHK